MRYPICPICGNELEYDEMYDEANVFDDIAEHYYEGHCENCRKVFRWVEVYKFSHYEGMEEIDELD